MNTGYEKDGAFILLPGSVAGSDVVEMLSGFNAKTARLSFSPAG